MSDTLTLWAVGLIPTGLLALVSFLLKRTLDGLSDGVSAVGKKLDGLQEKQAAHDTAVGVLQERLDRVRADVERLERDVLRTRSE